MANILISGFEPDAAAQLDHLLRARRHCVQIIAGDLEPRSNRYQDVDLMILGVSGAGILTEISDYLMSHKESGAVPPSLLCVARVYQGPRLELEVEKKGARLVYLPGPHASRL